MTVAETFATVVNGVLTIIVIIQAVLFWSATRDIPRAGRRRVERILDGDRTAMVLKAPRGRVTLAYTLDPGAHAPTRGSSGSAGLDLSLKGAGTVRIYPASHGVPLLDTGVRVAIPDGHVGLVVARSSLCRHGMALANGVGVIDSDYRGSIKLTLVSIDGRPHTVDEGDRLAQLLVVPAPQAVPFKTGSLGSTVRGQGGFGSTGV